MRELIHTYAASVISPAGVRYTVHAYGNRAESGLWNGWLVFDPVGSGTALRTERETTQPDRAALEYWAAGLEPIYLDGALGRTVPE